MESDECFYLANSHNHHGKSMIPDLTFSPPYFGHSVPGQHYPCRQLQVHSCNAGPRPFMSRHFKPLRADSRHFRTLQAHSSSCRDTLGLRLSDAHARPLRATSILFSLVGKFRPLFGLNGLILSTASSFSMETFFALEADARITIPKVCAIHASFRCLKLKHVT